MSGNILPKWAFIASKLEASSHPHKVKLLSYAEKFAKFNKESYETSHTEAWAKDYKELKDISDDTREFVDIVGSTPYCVACCVIGQRCPSCHFGRVFGICREDNSEYNKFWQLFMEEYCEHCKDPSDECECEYTEN